MSWLVPTSCLSFSLCLTHYDREDSPEGDGMGLGEVFEERFITIVLKRHGVNPFTSTHPKSVLGEVSKQDKVCDVKYEGIHARRRGCLWWTSGHFIQMEWAVSLVRPFMASSAMDPSSREKTLVSWWHTIIVVCPVWVQWISDLYLHSQRSGMTSLMLLKCCFPSVILAYDKIR